MDTKTLKSFIHVAELGSFTKAAKELGYAQSTISSQIKQLETELGVHLLERINHTVTLTSRGKEVLKYAHQMVNLAKDMEELAEEEQLKGHIRLVAAESMCGSLLGSMYLKFREEYPDITMKFMTAGTDEMMRLLNHNEVDLIYTLDSHIYSTEYVIAMEEKVNVHFIAGKDHPLSKKKGLSIQDIVGESFLLTEKGMSYRRLLDEKLAAESLEIQPILELGNVDQICWLVERGVGISFLPEYATEKAVREGRLVYLDVKDIEIHVWKQLCYHKDKWISPVMETVIDYCCNYREFE